MQNNSLRKKQFLFLKNGMTIGLGTGIHRLVGHRKNRGEGKKRRLENPGDCHFRPFRRTGAVAGYSHIRFCGNRNH